MFADPPYEISDLEPLLNQIDSSEQVGTNGLVVIEHFKKATLPQEAGRLRQTRQSRYGDTMLTFYHMAPQSKDDACV